MLEDLLRPTSDTTFLLESYIHRLGRQVAAMHSSIALAFQETHARVQSVSRSVGDQLCERVGRRREHEAKRAADAAAALLQTRIRGMAVRARQGPGLARLLYRQRERREALAQQQQADEWQRRLHASCLLLQSYQRGRASRQSLPEILRQVRVGYELGTRQR